MSEARRAWQPGDGTGRPAVRGVVAGGPALHGVPGVPALHGVPGVPALSREDSLYRRIISVSDGLADAALHGADPGELTRVFADLVGKRIVLLDATFAVRTHAGGGADAPSPHWDRSDARITPLLAALEAEGRPLRVPPVPGSPLEHGWLIAPIAVGASTLGFLLVLDDPNTRDPDDVDLLTTTYAATLFALTLANERTSTELGLRYARAVVDALVSGHVLDAQDARRKLRSLGLPGRYRVATMRVPRGAPRTLPDALVRRLAERVPEAVAVVRDTTVITLVADAEPAAAALDDVLRAAGDDGMATGGLSDPLEEPELAPQGLRQAEQATDLGLRLGRAGTLVRYDQLGIYRLLLTTGDMAQLRRFADDVLGPLVSYDRCHPADLVGTLSVYLRHHGSHKQTARTLRLHVNTVAYRMQRIEKITGLDLADSEDRLVAHVAVKIIESEADPGKAVTQP